MLGGATTDFMEFGSTAMLGHKVHFRLRGRMHKISRKTGELLRMIQGKKSNIGDVKPA